MNQSIILHFVRLRVAARGAALLFLCDAYAVARAPLMLSTRHLRIPHRGLSHCLRGRCRRSWLQNARSGGAKQRLCTVYCMQINGVDHRQRRRRPGLGRRRGSRWTRGCGTMGMLRGVLALFRAGLEHL